MNAGESAEGSYRRNSGERAAPPRRETRKLLAAASLALLVVLGGPAGAARAGEPGEPAASPAEKNDSEPPAAPASAAPILEGVLDPVQIISISPEWRENLVSYSPDAEVVERIRAITSHRRSELKVEAVLGTWCGDSRREVPHFIKVQQKLGDDRMPVVFMGVDRSKQHPAEAAEGRDIQRVPTFIVYHNGQEIGRIIEKPTISIEADLEKILASLRQEP